MATFSVVVSVWQQAAKARDELARDDVRGFDTIANTGRALSKPETQHHGNNMGSTIPRLQELMGVTVFGYCVIISDDK